MSIYVGQATVISRQQDGRPRVQVLGGDCATVVADWAIPFRYQAEPGDLLLVLGQGDRYWVTGIVHGEGHSTLAFRGDTELMTTGTLCLSGSGGVRIASPEVRMQADELETEVQLAVQRLGDLDSATSGTVQERAGTSHRVIDEEDRHVANSHSTIARKAVKIDGTLLRLS